VSVDWSKPIEAIHTDGRVVPVRLIETDPSEPYTPRKISPRLTNPDAWWFQEDGLWDSRRPHDWRIRNVAQAPETTRTAPSGGEVGPEVHSFLVPKLTEAQAREWVATNAPGAKADGLLAFLAEHSALLPEPVDADLVEARELLAQRYETFGDNVNAAAARRGDWDNVDGYIPWLVKALARGRALAAGDCQS
jgi:hypothetical protein